MRQTGSFGSVDIEFQGQRYTEKDGVFYGDRFTPPLVASGVLVTQKGRRRMKKAPAQPVCEGLFSASSCSAAW